MLDRIAGGIDAAIDALGRAVSWLTLAVVLLTFGVVVLRYAFDPRGRALADLAGTLFFLLPFCVLLVWVSADYVGRSWAIREGSKDAGGLPGLFLVKTLIPTCGVLLGVQGIAVALRKLAVLRGDAGAPAHGHPERL
jgi:TRAP-type mannitol/chloroaromatic compound transport system permease small subunit